MWFLNLQNASNYLIGIYSYENFQYIVASCIRELKQYCVDAVKHKIKQTAKV